MMEKIWLKRYQQGVPAEINPDIYPSLDKLFDEACKKFKKRPALTFFNTTLSYQKWGKLSKYLAAYLQHLGLKKETRVALMLPNCPQYMVALFGTLKAGLTVVNVNPFYTEFELLQQLQHAQVTAIVCLANFLPSLANILKKTQVQYVISTQLGDLLPRPLSWLINRFAQRLIKNKLNKKIHFLPINFLKLIRQGSVLDLEAVSIKSEDIAFLQYTGGTTGNLKAAMLTHRNMLANIEQLYAWGKPILQEGEEVLITALPLYHIFSLMVNGLMAVRFGGNNVLIPDARNIMQLIRALSRQRFSILLGVNTLFKALLAQKRFAHLDFSSLKIALGGGAHLQPAVKRRWKQITGKLLFEGYGLTEASPVACAPPWDLTVSKNSVGLPLPSTDIRLQDEQGNEVALGEVGELCIKGPQVMKAYWTQHTEQVSAFNSTGWLLTGDLARLDPQGFVFIVGRKKELILVSGFNVYPVEIEMVIHKHPKVAEVAVIGVPSEVTGEAIKAFVVRKDNSLTGKELLHYCRHYLTAYKQPTQIVFVDDLPKSNVGKILKQNLK
jgi:long-chain acyl-CoA synthetase